MYSKEYPISEGKWCLFETHYFDNSVKQWVPKKDGFRRCLHSKCTRKHVMKNRPTKICINETDCKDAGISCFLLHDNTKLKPLCYFDKSCCDIDCLKNRHSEGRTNEICEKAEKCEDALITCFKLHPLDKMRSLCKYGSGCKNFICEKRHPENRKKICNDGSMCYNYIVYGSFGCNLLHPKILQKLCKWELTEEKCKSFGCPYVHLPESTIDCPDGMCCQNRLNNNDDCPNKHPKYSKVEKLEDGTLYFE